MSTGDLLDFERAWPRHSSHKEIAIRSRGLTPARFYALLHRAATSLEGQAHDALTAHRVVRRRMLLSVRAHERTSSSPTSPGGTGR